MIALSKGDYKQNLFIDGFINTATSQGELSFEEYMASIFQNGKQIDDYATAIEETLTEHGVNTIRLSEWEGFDQIDWGEILEITERIKQDRLERGTYRSDLQCEAEAEVLLILQKVREGCYGTVQGMPSKAYFVTQSGVLRRVGKEQDCPVWSPEAFYRYLLCFPTAIPLEKDYLQQCMASEFFYSGLQVMNEERYKKFFGPQIREAKLKFPEVLKKHDAGEHSYLFSLSQSFDNTMDLEKPLFSFQAALLRAEKEAERAAQAEKVARLSKKEKTEYEKMKEERNLKEARKKRKKRQLEAARARKKGKKKKKRGK